MSYDATLTELVTLLRGTNLLNQVLRGDQLVLNEAGAVELTPAQCPGAVVARGVSSETFGSIETNVRATQYEVAVWFYGKDREDDPGTFQNLVESLQQAVRNSPALGHLADAGNTRVATARVLSGRPMSRPMAMEDGYTGYSDRFVIEVREFVTHAWAV